jgi:hypothetical protein
MGDPSLGEIQFSDSVIMGKSGVELEVPIDSLDQHFDPN